jgi:hypothetical protein
LFAIGTLPVVLFLAEGQRRAGRGGVRLAADVTMALLLCGGLAWSLTRAVAEGLWGATGEFVRTPKWGRAASGARRSPWLKGRASAGGTELAGAASCLALTTLAWTQSRPEALPFLLVFAAGSLWVGLATRSRRDA